MGMRESLAAYDISELNARTRNAILNSGWDSVADMISDFQKDPNRSTNRFLRMPNTGRVTLHSFLAWAKLENISPGGRIIPFTELERGVLRDAIKTHHRTFHRNGKIREACEELMKKLAETE